LTEPSDAPLVLFADDHDDTRNMYADFFAAKGFRVAQAIDGLAAIDLAKRLHPTLIVLDIRMPKMDGISALKLLRRHQQLRHTPILVLTSYDLHDTEAIAAGASAVCVKPCNPDKLLDEVRRVLTGSS
jgi:CheY-like chemotaxis protein